MNSSATLAHLKVKRAAVSHWVDAHEATADTQLVFEAHIILWERLDDAIEFLEARVGLQRLFATEAFKQTA